MIEAGIAAVAARRDGIEGKRTIHVQVELIERDGVTNDAARLFRQVDGDIALE